MRVPKPRISSCASVFEQRGDIWSDVPRTTGVVSHPSDYDDKMEAVLKKHGLPSKFTAAEVAARFKTADDPDFDRFARAKKSIFRPAFVDPPTIPRVADERRRLVNISRRLNREINRKTFNEIK